MRTPPTPLLNTRLPTPRMPLLAHLIQYALCVGSHVVSNGVFDYVDYVDYVDYDKHGNDHVDYDRHGDYGNDHVVYDRHGNDHVDYDKHGNDHVDYDRHGDYGKYVNRDYYSKYVNHRKHDTKYDNYINTKHDAKYAKYENNNKYEKYAKLDAKYDRYANNINNINNTNDKYNYTNTPTNIPLTDIPVILTTLTSLHFYDDPATFSSCPFILSRSSSPVVVRKYGEEYSIQLGSGSSGSSGLVGSASSGSSRDNSNSNDSESRDDRANNYYNGYNDHGHDSPVHGTAFLCTTSSRVRLSPRRCLWSAVPNSTGHFFLSREGRCYAGGCAMVACDVSDGQQSFRTVGRGCAYGYDESVEDVMRMDQASGESGEGGKNGDGDGIDGDGETGRRGEVGELERKYGKLGDKMKALVNALRKEKKRKGWKWPSWRGLRLSLC